MCGRVFPFLLVAGVIGCGRSTPVTSAPALPIPDELTLYAIDGLVNEPTSFVSDATHFRGYAILGKVEITNPNARQEIMKAVEDGMRESDGTVASCFWPRHGVHVVTNGKAIDYVICYECLQAYIFAEDGDTSKPTTATHQGVLTAPLTAAGIKLAPSLKEKLNSN